MNLKFVNNGVIEELPGFKSNIFPQSVATPAKEDFNNIKVLLHFDQSIIKDDIENNSWIAYNSPEISSTNAKFNKALQLRQSSNQYISLSGGITLGGQDFTIDWWGYFSSATTNYGRMLCIFDTLASNVNAIYFCRHTTTNQYNWLMANNISTYKSFQFNQIHHFAITYNHSFNSANLFIDGILDNSLSVSLPSHHYNYLWLGSNNYSSDKGYFEGSIDEFRITDGLILYKENFSLPSSPYSLSDNSIPYYSEIQRIKMSD